MLLEALIGEVNVILSTIGLILTITAFAFKTALLTWDLLDKWKSKKQINHSPFKSENNGKATHTGKTKETKETRP